MEPDGFLLDAFVARATDDRAALAVLDERYPQIDRVARYKIDRLREDVVLLQPARGVDSIGDFQQQRASAPSLLAPATIATLRSPWLAQAVAVSDPAVAVANLAACVVQLPMKATIPERVRVLDDFAIAFAQVPYERAIAWSEQLASAWWPTLTDAFGTNTHYGYAAVAGADALVRAVIGIVSEAGGRALHLVVQAQNPAAQLVPTK